MSPARRSQGAGAARPASSRTVLPGRPWPLGATLDGHGVNFAVFSAHATKIELCLFSDDGRREIERLVLPERDGDIWYGAVPGLTPGTRYGFRAYGPYEPEAGHRFNPNKLLIDPYARMLDGRLRWSDAVMGYRIGSPRADLSFDARDSAFAVPKSVVTDTSFHWDDDAPPRRSLRDSLIYEAHVKGLTMLKQSVPEGHRGTFLGLACDSVIDHLVRIGVTAIELLPVQAFVDDRFLVQKGLKNYWGYQTVGFFAPDPRYLSQGQLWEVQSTVRRLHSAGIEVILDVVYNHTGEGDELGPTLSFRGLDNASYYRLADGGRRYINDTGTGNTLNIAHPMVLRMVMDSLRYWVEVIHVDGFRFDLAATLGRTPQGFGEGSAFLAAIRQDPVLSRVKLIAEPWDVGPGGYRLGEFPHPFLEWNDRFRDGVRRFWRGDDRMAPDLAKRLLGSAEIFDKGGRAATTSVNYVTSHDGFTLDDLVSYLTKRNEANGEDNRDGHSQNYSDNLGIEGATTDKVTLAARARRKRNLLATLFLSQGTPMLLAGDEIGNGQGGNNNAYAQDNPTGWIDWTRADQGLLAFVQRLSRIRHQYPVLRQSRFLHGRVRAQDGLRDLIWRRPDGREPTPDDWNNPGLRTLCAEIRGAEEGRPGEAGGMAVFVILNAGRGVTVTLPGGGEWHLLIDTARPDAGELTVTTPTVAVSANSVMVLSRVTNPGVIAHHHTDMESGSDAGDTQGPGQPTPT